MEARPISIALADTILARFPDPDDIPYRRWCYVQGYVLCGLERLWGYTGDARYWAYLRRFVDQHVTVDGRLRDFKGDSLDDMMAGTVIVAAYEHTGEARYRHAADVVRTAFVDYPRNADGGFWHGRSLRHEMWIDGVFMGGMFLTRYGAGVGDRDVCFAETARQIATLAHHCRKGDSGLFLHGYDEAKAAAWADPLTGLSPEVWSEGLGWYALILVETLALMPLNHPDRQGVLDIWLELAQGLRRVQDAHTGLWYQVVDKGDYADNWCDTSGSAMFVYAIQRAIDLGLLDATYEAVARKGYAGLVGKVIMREDGLVDIIDACDGVCVQRSYDDYVRYPRVVNAKEAVGSMLWAATIMEKPQ